MLFTGGNVIRQLVLVLMVIHLEPVGLIYLICLERDDSF